MLRKKNIVLNDTKADGKEIISEGDSVKLWLSEETIEKFRGTDKTITPTSSPWDRVFDVPKGASYPIQNWCLFKNRDFTPIREDAVDSITKTMTSWGKGSRAIIAVTWKTGRGHVFNLINTSNGVYLMDATANRLKPIDKSDYIKNKIDTNKSFGLIRTDSGSPDKSMVEATFEEEGEVRFALETSEGSRIRARSTPSILSYLSYFKPEKGDTFSVQRSKNNQPLEDCGKIRATGDTDDYGDSKVYWYKWI